MKKKVLVISNIAPLYRNILWQKLLDNIKYDFHFLFGKDSNSGIKQINTESEEFATSYSDRIHILRNKYYKGKVLFWQSNLITNPLFSSADYAIITADFWVLTNWISAIILRIRGVKVIFWSHGFYGNEAFLKKQLRLIFFKLANKHLLYERRGKKLMVAKGFNEKNLHVIFNSLDYGNSLKFRKNIKDFSKRSIYPFFSDVNAATLIFIGRLTKIKKLDLLINSVAHLVKEGRNLNLLIIGNGNEIDNLKNLVSIRKINNHCHFYGPCYSEQMLSRLISSADLCVSPGNVGLTAIHCLSYGTPVLTHGNLSNQMPEAEAIEEGYNGLFFEEDNMDSMVESLRQWLFENQLSREQIRNNCYNIIDKFYNPRYQMMVIENLLNGNAPLV
ncbi:glycosyltransferase [Maribacter sp. 2210JD10-5]|uniref:glycosyltransferase n=1 Tax=Maribacter sp. 2210JD10-5 TaxID=3386272 RepID=UPI0039BD3AF7